MASNLRQNIDEAFTRRIAVIVEFPFPDAAARLQILSGLFPDGVERPDDDALAPLAERFRLAGGSARNVVLDAAFRAVAERPEAPAIGLRHLVVAIAREYQKLGKPITRGEFGEDFYTLLDEDVLGGPGAVRHAA
jgi:SpoVK/Ycf46/Vps4 family AAA+-type ATPase